MGRSAGFPGVRIFGTKASSFRLFLRDANASDGGFVGFTLNKLGCLKQANRLEYISMG
jgi:hypothetical protein